MIDSITIDNKYQIDFGTDENGKSVFRAFRYGEEWIPNLSMVDGSNMILGMAYRILELEANIKEN